MKNPDDFRVSHPLCYELMKDPVLRKIKQTIFHGLEEYIVCFSDFIIWRLFELFTDKKRWPRILEAARNGIQNSKDMLIYIHIPFCFDQCTFCNSFPFKPNKALQEFYIEHVIREAKLFSKLGIFENKEISCIYFGGGTPTCMAVKNFRKVLDNLGELFNLKRDCNITSEMHPVHAINDRGKRNIEILKKAGVNRVSIGAQTFNEKVLFYCARHQTVGDIEEALRNLKEFQLSNNIDMMIGLPGQTLESVKKDLLKLEKLKPDTVEYMRHGIVNKKVIKLYKNHPQLLVNKDSLFEMNWLFQKWMERNSYEQNGYFSKNSQFFPYRYYWVMETPYLALGSGARSHFGEVCFYKHKNLLLYFSLIDDGIIPIASFRILNKVEKIYRALFMRLQTKAGIGVDELNKRFGNNYYEVISSIIEKLKECSLLTDKGDIIRLTQSYGRYFLEDISCFIIKEATNALKLK